VERDRLAASAAGAIESGSIVIADGVRLASCRTTRRTLSVVDWRSPEVTGVVGVLKLGAAKSEPSTSSISNNTNEKTQTRRCCTGQAKPASGHAGATRPSLPVRVSRVAYEVKSHPGVVRHWAATFRRSAVSATLISRSHRCDSPSPGQPPNVANVMSAAGAHHMSVPTTSNSPRRPGPQLLDLALEVGDALWAIPPSRVRNEATSWRYEPPNNGRANRPCVTSA